MNFALRSPVLPQTLPALDMPDQDLRAPFRDPAAPGARSALSVRLIRAVTLTLPALASLALGRIALGWFALDGHLGVIEGALIAVTAFALYWSMLSVLTALLGLRHPATPPHPTGRAQAGIEIAILLPMYGEPARQTIGQAVRLLAQLDQQATEHRFSLHILSDSRDALAQSREQTLATLFRQRHPGLAIHYRHRPQNTDFKSGNIRDWVRRSGHGYQAMLILDADSLMGAQTVLRMADTMAADPGCGLLQTVPRVRPGHSLWQRMQSFASEVYGTNLGRGFALWTGSEGNFLGHNALVRTRAFAASAGLPHLPGRAPRGGVILSHDFVEAALLRRAGWGVRMLPEASDSFEDTPETLAGYLRRDKRWCQGNMQHLSLLATPGLHPVSRFHLLQGAMAYLASVWWMALLALWTVQGLTDRAGLTQPTVTSSFPEGLPKATLMPVWPDLPLVTQGGLTLAVALMLLAPKLIGTIAHIRDRRPPLRDLPAFGASLVAEILLSILLAPMMMVHQVRAVLRIMAGIDGGWMPHQSGRTPLTVLIRFHATETLLGLGLLSLALIGSLTPWLLPVAIGLCLTIPLAWLVQRPAPRNRLFRPLEGPQ
jgi:membrane glycosyltransferase